MKSPIRLRKLVLLITTSIALFGCQQEKQLADMHDATVDMRDTTKKVSTTSDNMDKKLDSQLDVSNSLNGKMDTQINVSKSLDTKIDTQIDVSRSLDKKIDEQIKVSKSLDTKIDQQLDVSKQMKEGLDQQLQTSEKMSGQLNQQLGASHEIQITTYDMFDALRQGDSSSGREKAIDELVAHDELPKKVAEATKYFWAYEFQLWSARGVDVGNATPEAITMTREHLEWAAMREFMMEIQSFYADTSVDPFANLVPIIKGTADQKREQNFNILALMMDEKNRKQMTPEDNPALQTISIYDILKDALGAKTRTAQHIPFQGQTYVDVTLAFEPVAWKLIQARHNMKALMLLGQMTDLTDAINVQKSMMMSWTADLSKYNDSQKIQFNKLLDDVNDTIQFLANEHKNIQTGSWLLALWKNMQVTGAGQDPRSVELQNKLLKYQQWLKTTYNK